MFRLALKVAFIFVIATGHDDSDWVCRNNCCYLFMGRDMTYAEAESYCAGVSASLASVWTSTELAFLRDNLKFSGDRVKGAAWIGVCTLDHKNDRYLCKWHDGSTGYHVPDVINGKTGEKRKKECLAIHVDSSTKPGHYKLDKCNSKHSGFVCKKPLVLLYQMGLPWQPDVMQAGWADRILLNETNSRVAAFSVINGSTLEGVQTTTLHCKQSKGDVHCAAGCMAYSDCLYFQMSCNFTSRCKRRQCRLLGRFNANHKVVKCLFGD